MNTLSYNGGTAEHPEQHLANRVTSYWATSKRMLELELRTDAVSEITPQNTVSVEGTDFYPISIGHNWRDDVTTIKMLEIYSD